MIQPMGFEPNQAPYRARGGGRGPPPPRRSDDEPWQPPGREPRPSVLAYLLRALGLVWVIAAGCDVKGVRGQGSDEHHRPAAPMCSERASGDLITTIFVPARCTTNRTAL